MSLLFKNILQISNPEHYLKDIEINVQHSTDILKHNSQLKLFKILSKYKTHIDSEPEWNQIKKISNIYEYIYVYNKYLDSNIGTSLHNPISRSFFKLYEMIQDLQLLEFNTFNIPIIKNKLTIVGLAEAPGGFMECIYTYRKKQKCFNQDEYYTMSLISGDKDVPNLYKLKKIIKNNPLTLIDGVDGTGSLYNYKNIKH